MANSSSQHCHGLFDQLDGLLQIHQAYYPLCPISGRHLVVACICHLWLGSRWSQVVRIGNTK